MIGMSDGSALSAAPGHAAALLAPLLLPIVLWGFFATLNLLDRLNLRLARQFVVSYRSSSPFLRGVAALLLLAGVGHLLLVPGHLGEDPGLAYLFLLDGLAFVALSIGAFVWRQWRPLTAILLISTLGSYLFYLITSREQVDVVGLAYYLIELVTLALVWIPSYQEITSRQTAQPPLPGSVAHRSAST